jgi:hypothetical protein
VHPCGVCLGLGIAVAMRDAMLQHVRDLVCDESEGRCRVCECHRLRGRRATRIRRQHRLAHTGRARDPSKRGREQRL